ncbi:MAG: hypothetical protein PHP69_05610 [Candidatus Omnitrophica bacterium]|nr:hypothetical protein [Candidatus Omnitrophota bacterium]MDD5080624.1 hypothetical protein [Candidatus Omnitrophota bacterium]MDD5441792.1 hypothetical protein [Candidatus Omnitrophota bacterium]
MDYYVIAQSFRTRTGLEFAKGLLEQDNIPYMVGTQRDEDDLNKWGLFSERMNLLVSAQDMDRAKASLKLIDDIDEAENDD